MNDDDPTPPRSAGDPTAAPGGRIRPPHAAVPGDTTDPVVGRLRAALDELTQGAEPNAARLPTTRADRRPRWMLPAVAAAAVALIVGIGIAVAGRDGGSAPAAPTPTGPPVTPAAILPSTIPWYGLAEADGVTAIPPMQVDPADYRPSQVWTSPDYSRVLVVISADRPEASTQPDDWPVMHQLPDPPSGVAWAFSGDAPEATWHGIYWAPDDHTSVVVTGYGFSPDDLAGMLAALHLEHDGAGPRVVSALSSLVPLADATPGFYTSPYTDPGGGITGGYETAIAVAAGGAARPLALWSPVASAITPAATPFGDGFRIVTEGQTHVWWPVDGGPFWAGLSAPETEIDDLLNRVTRVADVPAPAPTPEPDGPSPAETAPPETLVAPTAPEVVPVISGSVPSTWALNEPAMTAAAPSSFPGEGFKPPIAVGESVMLSAAASLGTAGITVYADEAIQATGVAEQLERLRDIDALGDAVIVQVGTNGTVTEADLSRIMAAVAGVERVVVLTAHADRSWIAPNNDLIRALPERYSNVVIVDWDQIATENPGALTSDGIHVEQREVYADAIASAIADR